MHETEIVEVCFFCAQFSDIWMEKVSNAARESNTTRQKIKIEIEIHDKQMASNRATVSPASSCDFGQEYGGLGEGGVGGCRGGGGGRGR